jgi:RNA 2',3'-cyclic 3'-phosphodiesterase
MRAFVAMPVPDSVKREVVRAQNGFCSLLPRAEIRWVRPDQMHLTLRFLGEVDPARLDPLVAVTRTSCRNFSPFSLEVAQAGLFPHERRPRVLWVGLRGQTGPLQQLQAALEAALADFAEKQEDRSFSPHLTLARIKSLRPNEVRALAARVQELQSLCLGGWQADRVEVMGSELRPEGSRYTCLASIQLPLAPLS